MQTCETCLHWEKPHDWRGTAPWAGRCKWQNTDGNQLASFEIVSEGTGDHDLLTGPYFGCRMHEPAAEVAQQDDSV